MLRATARRDNISAATSFRDAAHYVEMNRKNVMSDRVKDNPAEGRFELDAGGHIAAAYYRKEPGVITFTHTEVPQALAGQGVGSKLVHGALDLARAQGLRVVPQCPFVSAYLAKHPEFNDLLNSQDRKKDTEKKHLDDLLDEALEESFPASDSPAVHPKS
jgi:predicted GNAT family acetyltransferase